jgi:adenylate cyclase
VWSLDRASNGTAIELLAQALRIDPNYPLALALLAWCYGQRVVYNWSDNPNADTREALDKAETARDLASDDPFVLTVLGASLTITRQFASARLMIDRALALDPNSAWAWNRSGWLHDYLDDPETGIEHFEKALRISPFDPMVFNSYVGIAAAHFIAGRYASAIDWYERASLMNPKAVWINRILAPSYAFAGRQQEAEAALRKLLETYPGITIKALREAHLFSGRVLDRITEGLRRAGLSE